jgi:hypothetical protein
MNNKSMWLVWSNNEKLVKEKLLKTDLSAMKDYDSEVKENVK